MMSIKVGDECGNCKDCGEAIIFNQTMQDVGVTNPRCCHSCTMSAFDNMVDVVVASLGHALKERGLAGLDDSQYINGLIDDVMKTTQESEAE